MENGARTVVMQLMPVTGFGDVRHRFSRQPSTSDDVVPGDVVHNQPEERRKCPWIAESAGIGQL